MTYDPLNGGHLQHTWLRCSAQDAAELAGAEDGELRCRECGTLILTGTASGDRTGGFYHDLCIRGIVEEKLKRSDGRHNAASADTGDRLP